MKSMPLSRARPDAILWLYGDAFVLGARRTLASWPVLLGRCLFFTLIMVVLSSLWDKVSAERLAGTLAGRLPPGGLTLYVGVTEWITLSVAAVHLRLEDEIRSGALEPHLTRPKSFFSQRLFEGFGATAVRLIVLGATGLALLIASGRQGPPPIAYAAIFVLGSAGAVMGVLLFYMTGLTAFWLRRILPAVLIMQKTIFILGGLFAPISLYPGWLYQIAAVSPFGAHMYYPGLQMIAPSADMFWRGLAWQALWIAIVFGLDLLIWRAGLRRVLREGA
jgi:ABC-type uncharacterized transport system permease subunit